MNNPSIYNNLLKLIPSLTSINSLPEYMKSKSEGFMDLGFDLLSKEDDSVTFALSHYYKHHSGDMIPDPDMVIHVNTKDKAVDPISYQDIYLYQNVYMENQRNIELEVELRVFLNIWVINLIEQGHTLS